MSTEKATAKCDMCAPYDRPGYVLNAGQWVKCWQCAQSGVTLRETCCDCGKSHTRADVFKTGDRVRVRVHWLHRHRTGTVVAAREGHTAPLYDVDLDSNDCGPASVSAMYAHELWAEAVRS